MTEPILITGASRRIGLFLAKRLMQEGHSIIAHYRSKTKAIEELQAQKIPTVQGDLNQEKDILSIIEQVKNVTNSLRAIVHNASSYEPTSENTEEIIRQYELFFRVHMLAPYLLNKELSPLLLASKCDYKDIVHITDINAQRPVSKYDIYSSTKAGMMCLNQSFAKKLAPIKVNAIAPGPILFSGLESQKEQQAIVKKTLLKTTGGEESIYIALRCILENNYMTGSCIHVDGGRMLYG